MRKNILFLLGLFIAFVFVNSNIGSCNFEKDYLLNIAKERLNPTVLPDEQLKERFCKFLYRYSDSYTFDLPPWNKDKGPSQISAEEAICDIDYLFKEIKYAYAGYQYFGGDQAFGDSKRRIINAITKETIKNEIAVSRMAEILIANLDFIQDGHFWLNNHQFLKRFNLFYANEPVFLKDSKGYYTRMSHQKNYLINVNGDLPTRYLQRALNQKGRVIYRLGVLSQATTEPILNLKFRSGSKKQVQLRSDEHGWFNYVIPYEYLKIAKIPLIIFRDFTPKPDNIPFFQQSYQDIAKYKQKGTIILDIRSNGGGSDEIPSEWIKQLTGKVPKPKILLSFLNTDLAGKLFLRSMKLTNEKMVPDFEDMLTFNKEHFEKNLPEWSAVHIKPAQKIRNKLFMVVLMDEYTCSAAESFVRYLSQLENVIFIGTNTGGVSMFGNQCSDRLPNSKINIQFGVSISMDLDLVNREGRGYEPDFWVDPDQALDCAVKLIQNNFQ